MERFFFWGGVNKEREISAKGQHQINVEFVKILRVIVYDWQ